MNAVDVRIFNNTCPPPIKLTVGRQILFEVAVEYRKVNSVESPPLTHGPCISALA